MRPAAEHERCSGAAFESEADALFGLPPGGFALPAVYRCPWTGTWHRVGEGFEPGALRSRSRIVGWHLLRRRVMSYRELLNEVGRATGKPGDASAERRLRKALATMVGHGLIERSPRAYPTGYSAANRTAVMRVVQIGLGLWLVERGDAASWESIRGTDDR